MLQEGATYRGCQGSRDRIVRLTGDLTSDEPVFGPPRGMGELVSLRTAMRAMPAARHQRSDLGRLDHAASQRASAARKLAEGQALTDESSKAVALGAGIGDTLGEWTPN